MLLAPHFEITVLFTNSNIYPLTEFKKRYDHLKRYVALIRRDYGYKIRLVRERYDYESYMSSLRSLSNEREGGKRCLLCYEKRLERAFSYAKENGFEFVGTVMTSSREKSAEAINAIGFKLSAAYPDLKYLPSDFKKAGGQLRERELIAHYGIYAQNYCGCEYSLRRDLLVKD